MDKSADPSEVRIPLDFEWSRETGEFRCGTWGLPDRKVLNGTTDFATMKYHLGELFYKHPEVRLIGHNVTADLGKLVEWGVPLPLNFRLGDSQQAARLRLPDWPTKELKPLAREFGIDYPSEWETEDLTALLKYCGRDTAACAEVLKQITAMCSPDQLRVLEINNIFQRAYFALEMAAVKLDTPYLEEQCDTYSEQLSQILPSIPPGIVTDDGIFRDWLRANYTSADIKLVPLSRKSKEMQVDKNSLSRLPRTGIGWNDAQLPPHVQKFDEIVEARTLYDMFKSFILNPLEKQQDGFYPARYKLLWAKTHRRSTEPALQNWPVDARRALIPRREGGLFLSFDYKNLENRLFAWQCGCDLLLSHLVEGGYLRVAAEAFDWHDIADKKDPRYKVTKAIILALSYNMGPWLFKQQLLENHGLDKTEEEVKAYTDQFFTKYPEVYREIERRKKYMHSTGYAVPVVGEKIQPLHDIPEAYLGKEGRKQRRNRLENQGVNNPTQMLAGYVTGCALVDLQKAICAWHGRPFAEYVAALYATRIPTRRAESAWLKGFPVLEVHDELVVEAMEEKYVPELVEMAKTCMEKSTLLHAFLPEFDVPLEVEYASASYLSKA